MRGGNGPKLLKSRFTLLYQAGLREVLGDSEWELGVVDPLIERLSINEIPDDRTLVAGALIRKSELLIKFGREGAALQACEDFERRFDHLGGKHPTQLGWEMGRVRMKALLGLKRHPDVLDAFRSVYLIFDPADKTMVRGITDWVRELLEANVAEDDVERILSSDPDKSEALAPLLAALRQQIGKAVRVPKEVLEVAADIHDYLEGKEL